MKSAAESECSEVFKPLPKGFNRGRKFTVTFSVCNNPYFREIQNISKKQCLGKAEWPAFEKVHAWMISAETGTFMKWGGLGMVASELPEAFNKCFNAEGSEMLVVTPLYKGNTGKKKAELDGLCYRGAEKKEALLSLAAVVTVSFAGARGTLVNYKVKVYTAGCGRTGYIFLENDRFFSINPRADNPPAQDGCYVLNEHNVNEVERFAFFSKAVYRLIEDIVAKKVTGIEKPDILLANDWHSGAISGLVKYLPVAKAEAGIMDEMSAAAIGHIPVIHLAHHLGYQGWDYQNTAKILNSLYENLATNVFKNAKAVKTANPRTKNALIVYDSYNQAACNFNLADRVVTVSKNYMEEVSKELSMGFDFRDVLKIRKDHRNFFGIVNGYDKKLIAPLKDKIEAINQYFGCDFKFYDESNPDVKLQNKAAFIRLISKIARDKAYKDRVIPLVDTYCFEDIEKDVKNPEKTPIFCATSRLVEQKGYDIAAQAIVNIVENHTYREYPIFILGGAGSAEYFQKVLEKLKDKVRKISPLAAKRIFVFRGYKDEFAYAVQLAADFYMMPSRFEPCGLTQMEAMAKGALPVATSTGGLVDTIEDGTDGFRTEVFFSKKQHVYGSNLMAKRLKNNVNAYTQVLNKALETFYNRPETIRQMTQNAMRKDFSWDVPGGSVYKYHNLLLKGCILDG